MEDDRLITILINGFISCSARLPVYVLFVGAFFTKNEENVMLSLYLLRILVATIMAKLFKSFVFKGDSSSFVMELPPCRLPTARSIIIHIYILKSQFFYIYNWHSPLKSILTTILLYVFCRYNIIPTKIRE